MKKEEFLAELAQELQELSEEEREDVLSYYRDYLEEAEGSGELAAIGTPQEAAKRILTGLEPDETAGEFTENGYRDERMEEAAEIPDYYTAVAKREETSDQNTKEQREGFDRTHFREDARRIWENAKEDGWKKRAKSALDDAKDSEWGQLFQRSWKKCGHGVVFLILLLLFGVPVAGVLLGAGCSIIAAVLAALLGVLGGLLGVICAVAAGAIGAFAAGIAMIVGGITSLADPVFGIMMIGIGFLLLALGMLLLLAAVWGCRNGICGIVRAAWSVIKRAVRWMRSIANRMFRTGGEAG